MGTREEDDMRNAMIIMMGMRMLSSRSRRVIEAFRVVRR